MNDKNKDLFSRIIAFIIGAVFLWSGIGKAVASGNFGELISSYGLQVFSVAAPFIIIIELYLGLCLVFYIRPHLYAWVSTALLTVFSLAFFYGNVFHGVEDCGCFGSYGLKLPPWVTYFRNAVLLIMSVTLIFTSGRNKEKGIIYTYLISALLVVSSFAVGLTWHIPSWWAPRVLKPNPLLDVDINNSPLSDYVRVSNDSTYIVWVFSYNCETCINSINNIREYTGNQVADRFIPLVVSEEPDSVKKQLINIPFEAEYVGSSLVGFIKSVPTLIYIENGISTHVIEDIPPSAYYFKKEYLEKQDDEILFEKNKSINTTIN